MQCKWEPGPAFQWCKQHVLILGNFSRVATGIYHCLVLNVFANSFLAFPQLCLFVGDKVLMW